MESVGSIAQIPNEVIKIYALRLEAGKYYIGETDNFVKRLKEHQDQAGKGCIWTATYRVVDVEQVVTKKDIHDENNLTKNYMIKYGIDNVRGGSYVSLVLSQGENLVLQKELYGVQGLCFKCGKGDHYAWACPDKGDRGGVAGTGALVLNASLRDRAGGESKDISTEREVIPAESPPMPQASLPKGTEETSLSGQTKAGATNNVIKKCVECGVDFSIRSDHQWKTKCIKCYLKGI